MLLYKKLFYLGVANRYLSRVLNTIIADKIVMIKISWPKRPFPLSLSLNDNDCTFQCIRKSPVDMTIIRAMLSGSQ